MLHAKMDVFFRVPNDNNRRVLHPGMLVSSENGPSGESVHTVEIPIDALAMEPSQELLLYYQHKNKFMQQLIRVESALRSGSRRFVSFKTTGEAVSAESRQSYRVATAVNGMMATVGSEQNCTVNDVSATGFSILTKQQYAVGTSVPVTMVHEGKKYSGTASVQSVRVVGPGKVRYGMFCIAGKSGSGNLAQGLSLISTAMQRAQLRRMAGA